MLRLLRLTSPGKITEGNTDMQSRLAHNTQTGELRLAFTDLYDGQHELTEYRVVRDDGSPMRNRAELDGTVTLRDPFGGYYVKLNGRETRLRLEGGAVPTVKTPCRRAASKSGRAKCALCEYLEV